MFRNVLTFARNSEAQLKQSSFREELTSVTSVDDGIEGVTKIRAACTQYSSSLIIEQLKLAHTVDYKSGDNNGSDEFSVLSPNGKSYDIVLSAEIGAVCNCPFHKTILLPCRHIFFICQHQNFPIFENSLVANRWLKEYQPRIVVHTTGDETFVNKSEVEISTVVSNATLSKTLARNQKYNKMLSLCQKLAVVASQCGMADFREKYANIEKLVKYWESSTPVVITPINDQAEVSQFFLLIF